MYHRDLNVWREGVELVKMVYELLEHFPKTEEFALSFQIRKSVVSIPSNIAEGCGRDSDKELFHFLGISAGSLAELETQLIIAKELGFIDNITKVEDKMKAVQKLLTGFRKYVKTNIDSKNNQNA
ncbi:MAG: four helix bundle protein [Bacteroidales bacterium]|nr:four helix bundle protein [Bacteroidales bacterium]